MEKAMNLEHILRQNHDLASRIESEKWRIFYDRAADMFVLHGDVPEGSEYVPVNGEGLMVRADAKTGRICAFAIENFKAFADTRSDFRLIYLYLRHPVISNIVLFPILLAMSAKDMLTERYQRMEMIEYVSKEAMFGVVA